MENSALQPWLTEPDFAKWRDPATGLKCFILRHHEFKTLNGYVHIPVGPLRKRLANKTRCKRLQWFGDIDVHGGITFCGYSRHYRMQRGFWVGFDCSHAWDYSPGTHLLLQKLLKKKPHYPYFADASYRDLTYVKNEVTKLAQQISALLKHKP